MTTIYVNGKFLAQRSTGVQRAAREWLNAVDCLLAEAPARRERWLLLHPPGVPLPTWRAIECRAVGRRGLPLHLWEQWSLARAARDGCLLNLAGSSPWWARSQIATIHDAAVWDQPGAYTWAFRTWYRALFRHLAKHAAGLLTVSAFSQARLASCLGLPPGRLVVVPNGADHLAAIAAEPRVLDEAGLAEGSYVLAVASDNPSKNLARLALAVDRLALSLGLQLVLVGGANAHVFAAQGMPAGSHVRRLRQIDDGRLKALMGRAMAVAVPSLYEGFGLPPLEAMACGCPVAVARSASLPEVCADAALYFDPLSVDDMVSVLHRLATDPTLRERQRALGYARAAHFSWRTAGQRLLAEVRRIVP